MGWTEYFQGRFFLLPVGRTFKSRWVGHPCLTEVQIKVRFTLVPTLCVNAIKLRWRSAEMKF